MCVGEHDSYADRMQWLTDWLDKLFIELENHFRFDIVKINTSISE